MKGERKPKSEKENGKLTTGFARGAPGSDNTRALVWELLWEAQEVEAVGPSLQQTLEDRKP